MMKAHVPQTFDEYTIDSSLLIFPNVLLLLFLFYLFLLFYFFIHLLSLICSCLCSGYNWVSLCNPVLYNDNNTEPLTLQYFNHTLMHVTRL